MSAENSDSAHYTSFARRRGWYWRQHSIECECGFRTRWFRKLSGAGRAIYIHWTSR